MGVEAFDESKIDDGLAEGVEGFLIKLDEGGAFAEAVGGETGEEAGGAGGGRDVGGTGEVVSGGDGGVGADEDGSGVLDFPSVFAGGFGCDLQVFGGEGIDEGEGGGVGIGDNESGLANSRAERVIFSRESFAVGIRVRFGRRRRVWRLGVMRRQEPGACSAWARSSAATWFWGGGVVGGDDDFPEGPAKESCRTMP